MLAVREFGANSGLSQRKNNPVMTGLKNNTYEPVNPANATSQQAAVKQKIGHDINLALEQNAN